MKSIKRVALVLLILLLLAVLVLLYARFIEPNMLTVTRTTVQSDVKITPFKIVFFSDTHFGKYYKQEKIEEIVAKINNEKADIVIFGGDFFDKYNNDAALLDTEYLQQQMKKIEAEVTKLAVWGNHDYGGGSKQIYEEFMAGADFVIIKNSYVDIDDYNVRILGLDDFLLGRPINETDFLDMEKFNLMVSHAPDIVDRMDLTPVNLSLSGHSHGGQVAIPFVSKYVRPTGAQFYTRGLYDFDTSRKSKLFVTRGIGTTKLPLRLMSVPEISVVEVTAAP